MDIIESIMRGPGWLDVYQPLMDFCQQKGCVLSPSYSWQRPHMLSRGGGDEVTLYGPVTLEIILKELGLPETADVSDMTERWGRETYHFFDPKQGVHFTFVVYPLEDVPALLQKWEDEAKAAKAKRENSKLVRNALVERIDTKPTEH